MALEGRKIALFGAAGAIGQGIAAALRQAGRVREDHPREPHTFKVPSRASVRLVRSKRHVFVILSDISDERISTASCG